MLFSLHQTELDQYCKHAAGLARKAIVYKVPDINMYSFLTTPSLTHILHPNYINRLHEPRDSVRIAPNDAGISKSACTLISTCHCQSPFPQFLGSWKPISVFAPHTAKPVPLNPCCTSHRSVPRYSFSLCTVTAKVNFG